VASRLSGAVALALLGASCDEDPEPEPQVEVCPDGTDLTWDNFAGGFLLTWCTSCHGSSLEGDLRYGAPAGMNYDTYPQVVELADAIASAATGPDPRMPPSGGPSDEERALMAEWLGCGLPGEP
jgi:uncharacterized membrane protein